MRITIIDLDWYNKLSFVPNVKCMKLSSYHIQCGDLVNFPTNSYELTMDYDKMYIVREKMGGSIPKGIKIRDENVFLLGDFFNKFYSRYSPEVYNDIVAACRPDYTLYPIKEENRLSKADIVQFYNGEKRLVKIQDFKNTYKKVHYTLVVDDRFWSRKKEDVRECVKVLKTCKNIVFDKEISLKTIIYDEELKEMFLSLNLQPGSTIKFNNDCDASKSDDVIQFLLDYKVAHPTHQYPPIHFKSITLNHNENPNLAIIDFERCMNIIYKAKKLGVRVYIEAPKRMDTPFWFYFEELETWCKYRHRQSFIEHMFYVNEVIFKRPIEDIIPFRIMWSSVQSQMFGDLWRRYPHIIEKYGYLQWEDKEYKYFDFNKILGVEK